MSKLTTQDKAYIYNLVYEAIKKNNYDGLEQQIKSFIQGKIGAESSEDQLSSINDLISYVFKNVPLPKFAVRMALKSAKKSVLPNFLIEYANAIYASSNPNPDKLLDLLDIKPKAKFSPVGTNTPVRASATNQRVRKEFSYDDIQSKPVLAKQFSTAPILKVAAVQKPEQILSPKSQRTYISKIDKSRHDNVSEKPAVKLELSFFEDLQVKIYTALSTIKSFFNKYFTTNPKTNLNDLPRWSESEGSSQSTPTFSSSLSSTNDTESMSEYDSDSEKPRVELSKPIEKKNISQDVKIKRIDFEQSNQLTASVGIPIPHPFTTVAPTIADVKMPEKEQAINHETKKTKSQQVISRIVKLFTPSQNKDKSKYSVSSVKGMFKKSKKIPTSNG